MEMAQRLINNFISENCGKEWERGPEFTIKAPNDPDKLIKNICVQTPDGGEHKFYFDLSRSNRLLQQYYLQLYARCSSKPSNAC